jgi:hypothetical protein
MLAASLELKDDVMVDTSGDGVQLGREDKHTPSNPNLWDQVW